MPKALDSLRKNLEGLLAKAGWSQSELSKRSGVPQPHISQYLLGKTKPGLEAIEALSDAFGISVSKLIGDEDPVYKAREMELEELRLEVVRLSLDADKIALKHAVMALKGGRSAAVNKKHPSTG